MTYTHREPGAVMSDVIGEYRLVEERLVTVGGAEYLYLIVEAPIGSACVGAGSLRFIHLRGRVRAWKTALDGEGNQVSLLEPADEEEARAVRNSLIGLHPSFQIYG